MWFGFLWFAFTMDQFFTLGSANEGAEESWPHDAGGHDLHKCVPWWQLLRVCLKTRDYRCRGEQPMHGDCHGAAIVWPNNSSGKVQGGFVSKSVTQCGRESNIGTQHGTGKRKHGLNILVPWWFNFDPQPYGCFFSFKPR